MSELVAVLAVLQDLEKDSSVPKNVQQRVSGMIKLLSDPGELSIKIGKALDELTEISDDRNVQAYTRTDLLRIVSMLEVLRC